MPLIDMKLPPKSKDDGGDIPMPATSSPHERDAYPYGLRLDFEEPQIEKLEEAEAMPADIDDADEVCLVVRGYVHRYSKDKKQDGSWNRCLGIQITSVEEISIDDSGDKEKEEYSRIGKLSEPTR